MLMIDPVTKKLFAISATNLKQANVLERAHLQEAIIRSWEVFCTELGYDELFLVGSEIIPHESCNDRVDILALNRNGTPVVFELKRDRHKVQLLQALSYAAMVARWDAARFLKALGNRVDEDAKELRALLEEDGFELAQPAVVLIAESFDPEVILTADWLAQFGVPVSAFVVAALEHKGDTLISIEQRFPLALVEDVYVRRTRRPPVDERAPSWDEALRTVVFPFAERAVAIFRKRLEGDPKRRRFYSIYAGSPLGRMSIAVRQNYLKIYTVDQSPEAEAKLQLRLGELVPFKRWGSENTQNSGFTFQIETEAQFEQFLRAVGEVV